MSSILEALNRLEQEKQRQHAFPVSEEEPVTPEQAVAEMFGKSRRSNKKPVTSVHPWALMAGALLLGIFLTATTVLITVWLVSGPAQSEAGVSVAEAVPTPKPDSVHTYSVPLDMETDAAAEENDGQALETIEEEGTAPFLPEEDKGTGQGVSEAVPVAAPPSVDVKEGNRVASSSPSTVVEEKAPPPPVVQPVKREETPSSDPDIDAPASGAFSSALPPKPAEVTVEQAPPEQTPVETTDEKLVLAQPVRPSLPEKTLPVLSPPAARSNVGTVDVTKLPRLSIQEQENLELGNLQLNVLRPADKNQPDALAIINLKKVYVGEMIPGTPARLIAVDASAIGVEIDTGGAQKRFRIPR